MIVTTVLRSGGDYDSRWVGALERGVRRHLLHPHDFVCLTDMGCGEPLKHAWPGWWSKMEALDPDRFTGRVVLMDLDTLPVGNLYRLAAMRTEFAMLRALSPRRAREGRLISGVMVYDAGPGTEAARLYELFASAPERWMTDYRGDGEFIEDHVTRADVIQDQMGGIYSWKWEALDKRPPDATLILGHGRPRFAEGEGWARDEWERRAA